MTILCYLKQDVCKNLVLLEGANYLHHPATNLSVLSNGLGFHVRVPCDLFQEPDFTIRDDLASDVDWYSAKIAVNILPYTNEKFQTGNYDCGDSEVTLVVNRKIIMTSDNVLHREMTVHAPSWEKLRAAIEKIHRGEITPAGREQTVLERTEIALAQVEATNREIVAQVLRLTRERDEERTTRYSREDELRNAQTRTALLSTSIQEMRSEIFGHLYAPPSDEGHMLHLMRKNVRVLMANNRELANIKETRWYKIGKFFSDLIHMKIKWG